MVFAQSFQKDPLPELFESFRRAHRHLYIPFRQVGLAAEVHSNGLCEVFQSFPTTSAGDAIESMTRGLHAIASRPFPIVLWIFPRGMSPFSFGSFERVETIPYRYFREIAETRKLAHK
jgi:hypothetical protein